MRGEYSVPNLLVIRSPGSPPLAWGIPASTVEKPLRSGITPTCVGNTYAFFGTCKQGWDHPHLRGEYYNLVLTDNKEKGSPPLAWGIQPCICKVFSYFGITPTCVGNTRAVMFEELFLKDHPHLRGEYEFAGFMFEGVLGSPPLAWGIQHRYH